MNILAVVSIVILVVLGIRYAGGTVQDQMDLCVLKHSFGTCHNWIAR